MANNALSFRTSAAILASNKIKAVGANPYRKTSPYFESERKEWYLNAYVPKKITKDGNDILIPILNIYHHRPDKLSFDMYNSSDYWWVFAEMNKDILIDPIFDFVTGLEIYVPTHDKIVKLFN